MKFRMALIFIIIILDLLLMPVILQLPFFMKEHGFSTGTEIWMQNNHPFSGPVVIIQDEETKKTWLWLQPAIGALILGVLTAGRGFKSLKLNKLEGPEPAGSGQFGTSRWATAQEIDTIFTHWTIRGD